MFEKYLAVDRSARRIDADGRLHVDKSHISKAQISPYFGQEIPGFQELGLDAAKVYKLLRDPVELEKAANTFARLPILKEHELVTVDAPRPDLIVGAIGSDVSYNHPYLDADLVIWDDAAIAGVDTESVKELSCGYRYKPDMTPGEYEGQAYDGRMTDIQGSHLALVSAGRAGSDVLVADSNPFTTFEENTMRMTKLGKALFAALSGVSPVLAADSALPALVGNASRKTFKKDAAKAKLLALDSDIDPQQLDNIIDAILDVEQSPEPVNMTPAIPEAPEAEDESPEAKIRQMLAGKVEDEVINAIIGMIAMPAVDEKPCDDVMKKEDVAAAMDSLRKELRDASEAAKDVRNVVGDLTMDSAAEIYGFALDQMKVDRDGITDAKALRALFKVASTQKQNHQTQTIAQDSAGLADKFPGAARFRNA